MVSYHFFITFLISLIITFSIILTNPFHGKWTNDNFHGVQKIHKQPTPRIGGLSIILSIFFYYFVFNGSNEFIFKLILFSSIPIIISGLLEDITKKITPIVRFLCSVASGLIFIFVSGVSLQSIGIIGIDSILSYYAISVIFTTFCISGLTNSINIIDGFNGLASGSSVIMMMAFLLIGYAVNDNLIISLSAVFILSNFGFLIFNFPFGKIFLGDGGAYFSGFILAVTAILLPERNPEISPWVSFLICSYPIFETIVSIFRKTKRKGHHFSKPDKLHLHMLVYRDLSRKLSRRIRMENFRNPITSIILWTFPLMSSLLSILFFSKNLFICIFIIIILYIYIKFYKIVSIQKLSLRNN